MPCRSRYPVARMAVFRPFPVLAGGRNFHSAVSACRCAVRSGSGGDRRCGRTVVGRHSPVLREMDCSRLCRRIAPPVLPFRDFQPEPVILHFQTVDFGRRQLQNDQQYLVSLPECLRRCPKGCERNPEGPCCRRYPASRDLPSSGRSFSRTGNLPVPPHSCCGGPPLSGRPV